MAAGAGSATMVAINDGPCSRPWSADLVGGAQQVGSPFFMSDTRFRSTHREAAGWGRGSR